MKRSNGFRRFWTTFALASILFTGLALATDFSSMTTEELAKMRGTMCAKSQEERDAFRQEWQKRMAQMTPEERKQYAGPHHRMGSCAWGSNCMNGKKGCRCQGCMNHGDNS